MTIFPEDLLRRIRQAAPPLALLRKIGHHPESIQETGKQIKCFCPIHGEQIFRTLTIDVDRWTYTCVNRKCPGLAGGDLIDLYAKAKNLSYDQSLMEIARAFNIDVDPKVVSENLEQAREIGDNLFEMGAYDEAERQYEQIIATTPESLPILEKLMETRRKLGRADKLAETTLQLARLLAAGGENQRACDLLADLLRSDPTPAATRAFYVETLKKTGRRDDVAQEYLRMAGELAARGEIEPALDLYRKIQLMGVRTIDVSTQIIQMLLSAGRSGEAVAELVKRAEALLLIGQSRLAIDCLTSSLEIDPARDDLRARIGEIIAKGRLSGRPLEQFYDSLRGMIESGAHAPASQSLAALIAAFPDNPRLLELNAMLEEARGHESAAEEAWLVCTDLFENRREYDRALGTMDRLIARQPDKPDLISRRAQLLTRLGRVDEAAEAYVIVIRGFEEAGDWERAAGAYQAVIDLQPDEVTWQERQFEIYVRLGRRELVAEKARALVDTYRALGRRDEAIGMLERVWSMGPETEGLLTAHAELLEESGKRYEAAEQYLGAAKLLLGAGDLPSARARLDRALTLMPENMDARELRADVCLKLRLIPQAAAEYEALTRFYIGANEPQNAVRVAQKILISAPESPDALNLIIAAYEKSGEPDKKRAAQMRLATLLRKKKDFARAAALCEIILEADPEYVPAIEQLLAVAEGTDQTELRQSSLWRLAQAHRAGERADDEKRTIAQLLRADPLDINASRRLIEIVAQWGGVKDLAEIIHGTIDRFSEADRRADATQIFDSMKGGSSARPEVLAGLARLMALEGDQEGLKEALRTEAQLLARALRDREAVDVIGQLCTLLPEDLSLRRWRVELMLRSEMKAEAIEEYRVIADAHARLGQSEAAESQLREILKLKESDRPAREALITLQIHMGAGADARREIEELASRDMREGRQEEAIRAYERVFEFDPGNEEIYAKLIAIRRKMGDLSGAFVYYERLLDLFAEEGRTGAFEQTAHEAIQIAPERWAIRWRLAEHLLKAGRNSEALGTLLETASLQIKLRALEEANKTLRRALEMDKDSLQGRALLAELLALRGDKESALAAFMDLAGALGEMRPTAHGHAAGAAFTLGNYEGLTRVKEYTFDQFVVGARNNFAYASAMAVSRAPGKNYNPLFLYADVGLGKTHLCHAIANYVLDQRDEMKVMYTMTEDFTEALIDAIQTNSVAAFRNRHRMTDVLIIDDIQFLSGKERAQEEFFHIFNALFEAGKQIVITSDRPPKSIAHLEKRLRSRFGAGVIVDIQPPDLETRLAIIRRELIQRGRNKDITDEAAFALAESIPSNIRDLKGALIQALARHDATGEPIDVNLVQQVVDRVMDKV